MEFLLSNKIQFQMLFNNYIKIKKSHQESSLSIWLKIKQVTLETIKTSLQLGIMKNIYVLIIFGMLMSNKATKLKKLMVINGIIKLILGKFKEMISDTINQMVQFKKPISVHNLQFSILLLLVIGLKNPLLIVY